MRNAFYYACSVFVILIGLQSLVVKKYTFKFYPSNVPAQQQMTVEPCQITTKSGIPEFLILLGAISVAFTWTYGNGKAKSNEKKTK
ncbi:MAG: hypothetical protein Q4C70_08860 [Planctomycetia bacterium]|nr:hypothetical protein [Planctomycetia bacterium]